MRAPDLAASVGRETQPFKLDVRKLKNLGLTITRMVYLGGFVYLIDQWLLMRRAQHVATGLADHVIDTTG